MSNYVATHYPITKVSEYANCNGALQIFCGEWPARIQIDIFTGSPSLALELCAAMNEILARHKSAPAEPLSVVLDDEIPF